MGLLLLMGGVSDPNPQSLFVNNELGLAIDIGDRNGASEAKRTWRRNLLTYSDQYSNAIWSKPNATITANTTANPLDGLVTADTLDEGAATAYHQCQQTVTTTVGATYTLSVYLKYTDRRYVNLSIYSNGGLGLYAAASFDIQNGTVSNSGVSGAGYAIVGTPTISDAGNGWYRCSITATIGSTAANTIAIAPSDLGTVSSYGLNSYAGTNKTFLFFGSQFEIGSLSTYQPITDFNTEFKAAYPNHSLYVDSNGVAPAVYPGDQVGLVIDSSRGGLENLGAEKWVHASVDVNSTESQILGNQSYRIYSSAGSNSMVRVLGATTVGKWYRVEFTINSIAVAGSGVRIADTGAIFTTTGTKVSYWLADATQAFIKRNVAACDYTISNVSFKEIPGIHPYQTTSGSRPALCRTPDGGRRNLLTGTDAMATQSLTVLAVQHTLSFQGTGTVTLSGASTSGPLVGTGATNIVSLTFTPTAGSLTLTVTGTVQLAQLETGASRTAYQKVGLTSDVTESGKRDCWGLLFDGSDDSLQTASVDFSATDKMTVMTGVRKNTSSAGIVVELGASFSANTGSVYLLGGNDPTDRWWSASRGTQVSNADQVASVTVAAPDTAVISSVHDIAGDSTTIRRNSVADTTATGEKGSGNFRNDILYIGSRSGSLRFNGLIYTLIVRGATTPTGTIADFERNLLARRCGVTF